VSIRRPVATLVRQANLIGSTMTNARGWLHRRQPAPGDRASQWLELLGIDPYFERPAAGPST
jgi:hypothetical protein